MCYLFGITLISDEEINNGTYLGGFMEVKGLMVKEFKSKMSSVCFVGNMRIICHRLIVVGLIWNKIGWKRNGGYLVHFKGN